MALSSDWKFRCQISGVFRYSSKWGTDADPKKQVGGGGGYGLRFGLKIGKGPECEPTSSPTRSLSFPRTKTFCSLSLEFPKQDFQCF